LSTERDVVLQPSAGEGVLTAIRTRYHLLSPVQKAIADYIQSRSHEVIINSIGTLADACDTSETTIMRFLRKVGFDSFQVFKVRLAQDVSGSAAGVRAVYEDVRPDDSVGSIRDKVLASTTRGIEDLRSILDEKAISEAVTLMRRARRLLFVGLGATGLVATDASYEFAKLGMDVHVSCDPPIMNIMATHATAKDVVFAVSHSGETREVLDCVRLARANGARTIALTSYGESSLTRLADLVLLSSTSDTQYRSDAMLARIVQLVIIDVLFVSLILALQPQSLKRLERSLEALRLNKK
jgi:RpiR family transcriptional regulator, carbohydrate utilization regulator